MLGEQGGRSGWRSRNGEPLRSIARQDSINDGDRKVFIHAGESSSDDIISKGDKKDGIRKETEVTVISS